MWHFSQFDGCLCLTSMSKGSANHSQCLPLDRDANRALTDPVPPSHRLCLIHHPKQDLRCYSQTLRSCCSSKEEPLTYVYMYTHTYVDGHAHTYTPPSSITAWQNKLCITCNFYTYSITHRSLWQNIKKYEPHTDLQTIITNHNLPKHVICKYTLL